MDVPLGGWGYMDGMEKDGSYCSIARSLSKCRKNSHPWMEPRGLSQNDWKLLRVFPAFKFSKLAAVRLENLTSLVTKRLPGHLKTKCFPQQVMSISEIPFPLSIYIL